MKVLMFGWEFPPFNSGGLGTACHGLTKGLSNNDIEVTFVLPKGPAHLLNNKSHVNMVLANQVYAKNISELKNIKIKGVESTLVPYISSDEYLYYLDEMKRINKTMIETGRSDSFEDAIYGKDLFEEVHRFAQKASLIAQTDNFDIIHAHDWMTYPAAIVAKSKTNKKLVVHVHATEFDRTGGHPNQYVYDIEREGMHKADSVVTVSNYTKNMVVQHYGVDPSKIEVVHNAVDYDNVMYHQQVPKINANDKTVLFLGRITLQKGPDYFVEAAHRVLQKMDNIKFVVAGTGDMQRKMIDRTAELGIAKNFVFTGFLRGHEVDKVFQMADLYVMPSVSEPFGITPLESIRNGTPCLISKQSGVSEILTHCLKVDFWDIDQMANKMHAALRYDSLNDTLKENGSMNLSHISWNNSARRMIDVYNKTLAQN